MNNSGIYNDSCNVTINSRTPIFITNYNYYIIGSSILLLPIFIIQGDQMIVYIVCDV